MICNCTRSHTHQYYCVKSAKHLVLHDSTRRQAPRTAAELWTHGEWGMCELVNDTHQTMVIWYHLSHTSTDYRLCQCFLGSDLRRLCKRNKSITPNTSPTVTTYCHVAASQSYTTRACPSSNINFPSGLTRNAAVSTPIAIADSSRSHFPWYFGPLNSNNTTGAISNTIFAMTPAGTTTDCVSLNCRNRPASTSAHNPANTEPAAKARANTPNLRADKNAPTNTTKTMPPNNTTTSIPITPLPLRRPSSPTPREYLPASPDQPQFPEHIELVRTVYILYRARYQAERRAQCGLLDYLCRAK